MNSALLRLSPVFLATAALAVLSAGQADASVVFAVTVDTSSVNGTPGFLDFQFNAGNATTQAATATISDFTGGTLAGAPSTTGDVSGTLPPTITLVNSTVLNEYFQNFTYASTFSFLLTLSGPAIDNPNGTSTAGSTFGLGLYDSGQNPILTDQGAVTGFAGQVDINLNGTTSSVEFHTLTGPSVVTFQAVPEPGTMLLLGLGLAGLAAARTSARARRYLRSFGAGASSVASTSLSTAMR